MWTATAVALVLAVGISSAQAAQDGDKSEGGGTAQQGRADHEGARGNWGGGKPGGDWQGRGPGARNWQDGRGNHGHWQGGNPNRNWQEGRGNHDEGDWEGGYHYGHPGYYGWYGSPYYRGPYAYRYSYGGYGGCGWLYACSS
jgi:hypothetical protein